MQKQIFTLDFMRRLLSRRNRQVVIAEEALRDIINKDGNPEAIAEIALENVRYVQREPRVRSRHNFSDS